jgi:hypothetical protein
MLYDNFWEAKKIGYNTISIINKYKNIAALLYI